MKEATRLVAEWDPEIEAYRVTLDVRGIRRGAVIPLLENRGEWENLEEYDAYMEELLGIEIPDPEENDGKYSLPPMRVTQHGMTVRFDQDEGDFIQAESGSLIDSIALNANGELRISGETVWSINGEVAPQCPGEDDTAAINGSNRQPTDEGVNGFRAFQCSWSGYSEMSRERCVLVDQFALECDPVVFDNWTAVTFVEALPVTFSFPQISCAANDFGFFEPRCIPVAGDFVVIVRQLDIDQADIDNTYFFGENLSPSLANTPPITVAPFVEREGGFGGPRGVCGTGVSERNDREIRTETRDGAYQWGYTDCTF